jgi:metal-responsive CopG/Arc/MetJ family transcriptional regulator
MTRRLSSVSEMKRLSAYLPDPVFDKLDSWAAEEKRSLSNLVSYLLEKAIDEREKDKAGQQDNDRGDRR